jgi:FkbM family methyltransferase
MLSYESIASALIGTPLQRLAEGMRWLWQLPKRLRYPEMREIYLEAGRMKAVLSRSISPDLNCIDVGCHLGSVLCEMVRLSPKGHHIAVEPLPHKAAWLRRRFPTVDVHEIVLGEQAGSVELYYDPRRSGFSSLGKHGHLGQDTTALLVQCKRLDDIVPPGKQIGFLKIDVEGAELHVLRGGTRVLRESRPIILFECTRSLMAAFNVTASQVFSFLRDEIGYHVFLLKDWLGAGPALDLADFESAMVYPFKAFNFVAAPQSL